MSSSFQLKLAGGEAKTPSFPAALSVGQRSTGLADPFLNPRSVRVREVFDLSRASRAEGKPPVNSSQLESNDIVVLESESGETLFLSPETLRSAARRRGLSVESGLNLDALQPGDGTQRGGLGSLWKKASILTLNADELIADAKRKAVELAAEWLGEKVTDWVLDGPSWIGARAIVWAVESRLLQAPGVYRWVEANDPRESLVRVTAEQLAREAVAGPMLLFLHGTGSNTAGSFADLRAAGRDWESIERTFGDRIYALEHRTLSESPVENALALARTLPAKARLSVVTHSRGGLVGDLLCLGGLTDDVIAGWQRRPAPGLKESEIESVTERERQLLGELRDELSKKDFHIERYVRVACPARGTLLASGNFDVFLSGLLSVLGTVTGLKASGFYSGFARILMEVVKRRMDPQTIPGLEAMLPDAPLPELLSRVPRKAGVQMAVIAGDIEGGGFWQRVGVLFTDWTFFDRMDNDLVVDTDAMYEGLARQGGAHGLFDQGPRVNHFRYFDNARTRSALSGWLTAPTPDTSAFEPIAARGTLTAGEATARRARGAKATPITGLRPVVVFLPGTMGSHLELKRGDQSTGQGNRIWFDVGTLTMGGFAKLRVPDAAAGRSISSESLFEMFYGKLCDHLESTHEVERFAYDWRKPIEDEAKRLGGRLEQILDLTEKTNQPVRLLAHSMGGLVCRAMIASSPKLWQRMVAHPSARFIMLGTPNNGSHLLVQHLIGKAGTTRTLAKLDLRHDLQEILNVAATMPGVLQLMPRPGFTDTAAEQASNYFEAALWADYRGKCFDRWFGDGVCAQPTAELLGSAGKIWSGALASNQAPPHPERVHYVFGFDPETPCGIRHEKDDQGREVIRPLMTAEGDGSVTWKSGRLEGLDERNLWWIEASHGDLTRKEKAFAGIVELLEEGQLRTTGDTAGVLPGFPRSRSARPGLVRAFEAGPPRPPTEEESAAGLMGNLRPVPLSRRRARRRLQLAVSAGDLRFARHPVLCGHYQGDPIAGAESMLDRYVVNGGLRQRERLGFYAAEIGSSTIVLLSNEGDTQPISRRGAVVLGLGEYGKLSVPAMTETVRAGVLRFLIGVRERQSEPNPKESEREQTLAPLLVGYNSTTHITIDDSIGAIVRGVMAANRQFLEAMGPDAIQVTRLEFVELYLDTAISAAHALVRLPERLKRELAAEQVAIDVEPQLHTTTSARRRLSDAGGGGAGYWPRLLVTDADQLAVECPPECFEVRRVSAMPPGACRELLKSTDCTCPDGQGGPGSSTDSKAPTPSMTTPPARIAERLRYLYLSERARAESVVKQRQPQLIEQLVDGAITSTNFDEDLSRMFFQLMIPLDFKEAARHAERLVLVVDSATSSFPWEMLVADDEPMIVRTMLVRQFATSKFRSNVRGTVDRSALVIGDPSTARIGKVFPIGDPTSPEGLIGLPGAGEEAEAVRAALSEAGYLVNARIGQDADARTVMAALFRRPYRIVHIAAHGLFELPGRDGLRRTGVVLSDGLVLSASEIEQMEIVPEIVFLNCCHLGRADAVPRGTGRLASSIARELIDMGVRCVVAAGWEVDDGAASLFARTFYESMLADGRNFAEAVTQARLQVWQQRRQCNTWGAYQAYGDPAFKLAPGTGKEFSWSDRNWVSPLELQARIDAMTVDVGAGVRGPDRKPLKQDTKELARTKETLRQILESAPAGFLLRAEIQASLGRLYGDLGEFEQAMTAYEAAIAAEDPSGDLPVRVVEQVANLEAREGDRTGDLPLIRRALSRLEGLLGIASEGGLPSRGPVNSERWSVYASACKRMARWLIKEKSTSAARQRLVRARDAYAVAAGRQGTGPIRPYPAINQVQLDAVLGELRGEALADAVSLVNQAGEAAVQAFSRSGDFFDAVMPVDADLTRALAERRVAASADDLLRRYLAAASAVPSSERQFNSVVRQLAILADFAAALGLPRGEVEGLRRIAGALGADPGPTSTEPRTGPARKANDSRRRPRRRSGTAQRRKSG
jgi:CHAT domain-containing protein/pimeloyl-ACP methyl ester carboxylesterase